MADVPANRKVSLKPATKPKIDINEAGLFAKKVDINLWETASEQLIRNKTTEEPTLQSQILKFKQEVQKQNEFLPNSKDGNKLNINC